MLNNHGTSCWRKPASSPFFSQQSVLSLSFLAILIALAGSAGRAGASLEELPSRVRRIELSNGLTALLVERHLFPTVSFHCFFPVGSLDDEPGRTGLAHMFEHMMFKGTRRVGVRDAAAEEGILEEIDRVAARLREESAKGAEASQARLAALRGRMEELNRRHEALIIPEEYWKIYEGAGARGLNAGTGADFTVYNVELPSNKIELWMAMESDRLARPVLREFYKERAVVMEERRLRVDDSPFGKLWEAFTKAAFERHPYGQPTVGTMEDLNRLSRRDAERFYRRHYRLSSGVVAIVGDFKSDEVEKLLRRYFGPLRDPPLPSGGAPAAARPAASLNGVVRVEVPFPAEPEILVGYLRPPVGHRDEPALEALGEVLDFGRTSRLYRGLVEGRRVAVEASVWTAEPGERDPCLFVLKASPRSPSGPGECLKALDEEIADLQKRGPEEWELEKVKNNAEAQFLSSLASNSGLGWRLGYYEAVVGDWRYILNFLERLRALEGKDVREAALKYLTPGRRVIAVRVRGEAR